ncbi:MAG: DUF359 domain-containing protein [Candidatus Micrarchaeia archaeon]
MDKKLREKLACPFGELTDANSVIKRLEAQKNLHLSIVGDESLHKMLCLGVEPQIAIYDNRCMRKSIPIEWKQKFEEFAIEKNVHKIKNPAGKITKELEATIKKCLQKGQSVIEIDGEEDLAALVLLANAREGMIILYGQPKRGMVWLEANMQKIKDAKKLMKEVKKSD